MGSKVGLGLALIGGILYIVTGVTTYVDPEVMALITAYVTVRYPTFADTLIPIIRWLTTIGGIGVIIGGIVAYVDQPEIGKWIIIISILGGMIAYGLLLYFGYQAGVFNQPYNEIIEFLIGLGTGLIATIISILAAFRSSA